MPQGGTEQWTYRLTRERKQRLDSFLASLGFSKPTGGGKTRHELGKLLAAIADHEQLQTILRANLEMLGLLDKDEDSKNL